MGREARLRHTGRGVVEAEVDREGDVRLGKPPCAAAIVHCLEFGVVDRERRRPVWHERPRRWTDAARDVAPPMAGAEVERQLRRKRRDLRLCSSNAGRRDTTRRRSHQEHLPAEADRHRLPPERIDVRADLQPRPATGQLAFVHATASSKRHIVGSSRKRSTDVDDERSDRRRRILRKRGALPRNATAESPSSRVTTRARMRATIEPWPVDPPAFALTFRRGADYDRGPCRSR